MKFRQCLIFILVLYHPFSACIASETDSTTSKSLFIYPVFFYTPETGWAYGAAMTKFSRPYKDTRPSTWNPMAVYTQKQQIIIKVTADLYGKDEKWNLISELGYYDYPDRFYGIGSRTTTDQRESYTAKRILFDFSPRYRIRPDLYLGFLYNFMHQRLSELEEDGSLILKEIPGSQTGQYSGIGVLIRWDTRDNIFFPREGHYRQLAFSTFGSAIGSDYTFHRMTADIRQYLPVMERSTLALQAFSQMIDGTAPFQILPAFGDSQKMRGYYGGRFRDNHFITLQSEYRFFFSQRMGASVFGGIGDVARHLKDFQFSQCKYSYGFGFRMCINPEEKMHLRVDFAYGENTSGYYVEISEAF